MTLIEIYTTRFCPYCVMAKRLLTQKHVQFHEISVDDDDEARATMRRRASGGHTVPQIFVGDTHVGGCDDLFALESSGSLDPLLSGAQSKHSDSDARS